MENLEMDKLTFIGKGSYGVVYSGPWTFKNGEQIQAAFKTFHNTTPEDFKKEKEAMCKLDHLFIVKYYGTCTFESKPYVIVMELCFGSLQKYIDGKLPDVHLENRLVLGQVTLGLAYIHSKGMIHKDLKPDNILLWRKSSESTLILAKIADLGYLKELKPGNLQFSQTTHLGTPGFKAPELLETNSSGKAQATFESDAYALGITIGYTILGRHPFDGGFIFKDLLMKQGSDPTRIGELEWDAIDLILNLTKPNPSKRAIVALVIFHPYFVLKNDNTKNYFVEKTGDYFKVFLRISPLDMQIYFMNRKSIEEWMGKIQKQKGNKSNNKAIDVLKPYGAQPLVQEVLNHLESCSAYYSKIANETTLSRDDPNVSRQTEKPPYRSIYRDWRSWTHQMFSATPKFLSSYMWHYLNCDRSADFKERYTRMLSIQKLPDSRVIMESLFKMTECAFGFLFIDKLEDKMELWNLKYPNDEYFQSDQDIHTIISDLPYSTTPPAVVQQLFNGLKDINSSTSKNGNTILHWILGNRWIGDLSTVTNVIQKGADPNLVNSNKKTAVHLAVKNETKTGGDIVKFLLDNNGDPNKLNKKASTPMHFAAKNESTEGRKILEILLQHPSKPGNPNVQDFNERTPVHFAATNELSSFNMEILLKRGGNPNQLDHERRTPIHFAAENQGISGPTILEILLKHGSKVDVEDFWRETPLHFVAQNLSVVGPRNLRILLGDNANRVNSPALSSITPVHYAAANNSRSGLEILKILLKSGGDPNKIMKCAITPLHYSIKRIPSLQYYSEPEDFLILCVNELLNFGANPRRFNEEGETPLHQAAQLKSGLNVMKIFYNHNFLSPNFVDRQERTLVHHAAANCKAIDTSCLQFLLENGGDPNLSDVEGKTPVHLAASNHSNLRPDILKLLIDSKGDPNIMDKTMKTPLHYAIFDNEFTSISSIELLLENGGDPNIADIEGKTLIHLAASIQSNLGPIIVDLLLKYNSDPKQVDKCGITPIHLAALNNSDSMLKCLLDKSCDLNVVDNNKRTCFHYAAKNDTEGGPSILQFLLNNKMNPNIVDDKNETPVHYATKFLTSNLLATLKLLLENGANPNGNKEAKVTPLHYICEKNLVTAKSAVNLLLEYGADLNFNSSDGIDSYLYDLAANNEQISDTSLLEFFLEKGANPNAQDNRKMTPVHWKVKSHYYGEPKALKVLLIKGGNPNAGDECNKTPVHLAAEKSDFAAENVLQLLLDHDGNPNSVDSFGNTPVHYAAMNESEVGPKLLEILLKNKIAGNPDIVYDNGKTLVHYAAENKTFNNKPRLYLSILEFLLEKKCDPNKADNEGRTPVHLVAENKSGTAGEILNCLLKHGGDPNVFDNNGKKPIDYARILGQQFFGNMKTLHILEKYESKVVLKLAYSPYL